MNKAILLGRLAKDPELRATESGVAVCSFTVACDRRYAKEGEKNGAHAKPPEGKGLAGKRSNNGADESFAGSKTEEQNLLRRQADFIKCVAWDKNAVAISNFFSKGKRILIEGTIQVRRWDSADGQPHYVTEVVTDRWEFADSRGSEEEATRSIPEQNRRRGSVTQESDDIEGFIPIDDIDLPF